MADKQLLSASFPYISKHISVFQLIVSSLIALLGGVAIVGSLSLDASSSTLSIVLLTLGTIFLLVAIYRFFWRSKERIYIPTGSVVYDSNYYFDISDTEQLAAILEKGDFSHQNGIELKMSGNLRMDCMMAKDRNFIAVQLYRFVPYTYEPMTPIYHFTGEQASQLMDCLERKSF